jgi:hypothetical protein
MDGKRLLGVGSVRVGGVDLRDGSSLLTPYIRSVDGVDYAHVELREIVPAAGGGVDIHTIAHGEPRLESAFGDEYDVQQIVVGRGVRARQDELIWHLRPAMLELDGVPYRGFSYAWTFRSDTEKLYRIIVHATWELGGKAAGNTILSQGQVTPAVYTAEKGTRFTSACLKSLSRFGEPLGMSFQLCPRYGLHQCFDFLAHDKGTLLGFWAEKADIRSFVQKNPGEDVFFVVDAHHFPVTGEVALPAKTVLFAPSGPEGMPEHVARNRWKAAYDYCVGLTRKLFGIRPSRPLPRAYLSHQLHQTEGGKLLCRTPEGTVPPDKWLAHMADHHLEAVARRGIKRIWTDVIVLTDATERGWQSKLQAQGPHGDWLVGSACNVHRYVPAPLFGGMAAWRYFYDKASALGLEVGHWMGCNMAYNAPIFKEHPDWMVYNATSLPASGGYPNFMCALVDWNSPARDWIFADLKTWKSEGGLDFVFIDSWANLGLQPVNFAKGMATNAFALSEFVADLQREIGEVMVEGVSPLVASAAGITDFDPKEYFGAQGIAGQNAWEWYEGNEDMLCDQTPHIHVNDCRDEESVRRRHFRCLANRCVGQMTRFTETPWYRRYLDSYLAVEQNLRHRELLPDKQGVLWRDGSKVTLFAFKDFDLPAAAGSKVIEFDGGTGKPTPACGGRFAAQAWTVYQLEAH